MATNIESIFHFLLKKSILMSNIGYDLAIVSAIFTAKHVLFITK